MEHKCSKEAEISRINERTLRLSKILEDNGQPGLYTLVIRLRTQMEQREKSEAELIHKIDALGTAYSAVYKFQIETEASIIAREKEKAMYEAKIAKHEAEKEIQRVHRKWLIYLLVTASLTIAGLILSL